MSRRVDFSEFTPEELLERLGGSQQAVRHLRFSATIAAQKIHLSGYRKVRVLSPRFVKNCIPC